MRYLERAHLLHVIIISFDNFYLSEFPVEERRSFAHIKNPEPDIVDEIKKRVKTELENVENVPAFCTFSEKQLTEDNSTKNKELHEFPISISHPTLFVGNKICWRDEYIHRYLYVTVATELVTEARMIYLCMKEFLV